MDELTKQELKIVSDICAKHRSNCFGCPLSGSIFNLTCIVGRQVMYKHVDEIKKVCVEFGENYESQNGMDHRIEPNDCGICPCYWERTYEEGEMDYGCYIRNCDEDCHLPIQVRVIKLEKLKVSTRQG